MRALARTDETKQVDLARRLDRDIAEPFIKKTPAVGGMSSFFPQEHQYCSHAVTIFSERELKFMFAICHRCLLYTSDAADE